MLDLTGTSLLKLNKHSHYGWWAKTGIELLNISVTSYWSPEITSESLADLVFCQQSLFMKKCFYVYQTVKKVLARWDIIYCNGMISKFDKLWQKLFFCKGYRTASVIIALTDGELHEDLFYYAEREVKMD